MFSGSEISLRRGRPLIHTMQKPNSNSFLAAPERFGEAWGSPPRVLGKGIPSLQFDYSTTALRPLTTHTADDIKSRYTIWLAHWCNQTNYRGAHGIWQHSEKGSVNGINGNVDLDIGYKDFPTIIKAKELNGYNKEEVLPNPPAPAAEDGISVEVTVDGQKYSGKLNKA